MGRPSAWHKRVTQVVFVFLSGPELSLCFDWVDNVDCCFTSGDHFWCHVGEKTCSTLLVYRPHWTREQGDLMSPWKVAQNVDQRVFCSKLIPNFYRGKSATSTWTTSVILKNLSNVNNRPMGENSPNLVTLHVSGCYVWVRVARYPFAEAGLVKTFFCKINFPRSNPTITPAGKTSQLNKYLLQDIIFYFIKHCTYVIRHQYRICICSGRRIGSWCMYTYVMQTLLGQVVQGRYFFAKHWTPSLTTVSANYIPGLPIHLCRLLSKFDALLSLIRTLLVSAFINNFVVYTSKFFCQICPRDGGSWAVSTCDVIEECMYTE
jgi:hypothetical protein